MWIWFSLITHWNFPKNKPWFARREKCPNNSELLLVRIFLCSNWIRRFTVFSARIQSEYSKIRTRNNSVFGHFSRSVNACFKFITYITYLLVYMYISYKFFDLLQSSSSRVKMVNHYEVPVIFQDIEHQLKVSLITFFVIILYKTFTKKYLRTTQICLLEAFATFPNHINHLHPNI